MFSRVNETFRICNAMKENIAESGNDPIILAKVSGYVKFDIIIRTATALCIRFILLHCPMLLEIFAL